MTHPSKCPLCGGPCTVVSLPNGQYRYSYACLPFCRIRQVIDKARSPRDEMAYLDAPERYEPSDYEGGDAA